MSSKRILAVAAAFAFWAAPAASGDEATRYVNEVREHFTLQGQPIHPSVIGELTPWLSDRKPTTTAVDLLSAVGSNRYFAPDIERRGEWLSARDGRASESYRFIGRLDNDLLAVLFAESGGGSGVFVTLLFLDVVADHAVDHEGQVYDRINLVGVQQNSFGDRWNGAISINGNTVVAEGTDMAHMGGKKTTTRIEVRRP
jgi:hypothetical protein